MSPQRPRAIVVGTSAGGLAALGELFSLLPAELGLPVLVVQHLHPKQDASMHAFFNRTCALHVKEAEDKEPVEPGRIYFAPPDYHLLVERDGALALSADEKVRWSRPSIDVLFESAVYAYAPALIGVILTGANGDGTRGLQLIREHGGLTIAQDPRTCEYPEMPRSAIAAGAVMKVLTLKEIGAFLTQSACGGEND